MGVPNKFSKTPYHSISENATLWNGVGTRRPEADILGGCGVAAAPT